LKIFEYLSTGKPIVATRIPAHLTVLNDNLAIIVDVNSESVADGVIRALSDATLANKVGGNGKRFADDRLSWRSFVTMMDELISTLVSDTDQGGAGSANAASRDSA
jgi:glycosyltransferase involved in cell wall biosynthesis